MKRTVCLLIVVLMLSAFAFAGCSRNTEPGDKADNGKDAVTTDAPQTAAERETVGNIALNVPEGWVVVPGNAGGQEDDNSLFLKENDNAREYIWVTINRQANIDSSLKYNNSAEIAPFELNGVTWQGKETGVYGDVGGTLFFVMTYGYTANDQVVRDVLASLSAAE